MANIFETYVMNLLLDLHEKTKGKLYLKLFKPIITQQTKNVKKVILMHLFYLVLRFFCHTPYAVRVLVDLKDIFISSVDIGTINQFI